MSRLRILFMLAAVLLFGSCSISAATYAVGTCKPTLPSFLSISAAVSSVPAGSTIEVCPGTYAEQVIISNPLTLEGISSGGSAQVVITVPGGGLPATSSLLGALSPQVLVEATSGPVDITNITVDGSAFVANSCATILAGIYYDLNSSGTVDQVTIRNEINSVCGFGILAEGGTANELLTIENSSIHAFDYVGIWFDSIQLPDALTAIIKNNYIEGGITGIYINAGVLGSVTGNLVTSASQTAIFAGSSVPISSNTVTNSQAGIWIQQAPGISVITNKLSNNYVGIEFFESSGITVKSNTILKSYIGIEFDCNAGNTVSGNVINDATTGLDLVPSGSTSSDAFLNVATIRSAGCAAARPAAKSPPTPFNHRPN
jgi:parallel beta-helix repeat protein